MMSQKMTNWKEPDGSLQLLWVMWGISTSKAVNLNVRGLSSSPHKSSKDPSGSFFMTSLLVHSVCVSRIEYLTPWHCQYPNCGVAIDLNYVNKFYELAEKLISFCYQKSHDGEIR